MTDKPIKLSNTGRAMLTLASLADHWSCTRRPAPARTLNSPAAPAKCRTSVFHRMGRQQTHARRRD